MRSVPTKTTPRAIVGVLYLPPEFKTLSVLRQMGLSVAASTAYKTVCGAFAPVRGCERRRFASNTQTIASLDPLLVTTGDPGLRNTRLFSAASTRRKAGDPGAVTMRSLARQGGTTNGELTSAFVEPETNK